MPAKARLALGTIALCALVLLPFVARFVLDGMHGNQSARPVSDAAQLIRRQQYSDAYAILLQRTDIRDDAMHQYRLAACERAIGLADSAYARLLRLEDAIPLLEDYRRMWIARSLETVAATAADSAAAIDGYRDLLSLDISPAVADSARLYLASLLRRAGHHEAALKVYAQHRKLAGTSAAVLYQIAETSRLGGRADAARRTNLELMQKYPGHRLALDVGRALKPRTWDERYARAQVFFRHRDDRRAIDDLRQLLRSDMRHKQAPHAEYVLGRAYARSGQLARARHTFERLHEHHGWPSALYRLAGLQVKADKDLDAVATYQDFARKYPDHELADDALWQAAKAAERNDRFKLAGEMYSMLARDHSDSQYAEESAWGEGFSHYCRGQYEAARRIFGRVARQARQPHIIDQSLFWAGKSAERLDESDEAKVLFTEAARGFPRSYYSSRAISLGYGVAGLQPRQSALRAPLIGDSLDLENLAGADHVRRALVLGEIGLARAAEAELRRAERLNKGNARALLVLRDGYDVLGLHDRALRLSVQSASADDDIGRLYPNYYWNQVARAAQDASVDPFLVLSVIRQESYFNEDAISHAGAMGLMQIMPQTGRKLAGTLGLISYQRALLFDPSVSIQLGTWFLADQVRSFAAGSHGLQFPLGLAAYNAGPRVARRWLERFPIEDQDAFVERIPYKETRLYVKKVLKNYTIYKTLNPYQTPYRAAHQGAVNPRPLSPGASDA